LPAGTEHDPESHSCHTRNFEHVGGSPSRSGQVTVNYILERGATKVGNAKKTLSTRPGKARTRIWYDASLRALEFHENTRFRRFSIFLRSGAQLGTSDPGAPWFPPGGVTPPDPEEYGTLAAR